MTRIALALLWSQSHLVMQLRDFRGDIADPGMWGFFGGHLEADEPEEHALRRELHEEIGWCPATLRRLGTFDSGDRRIVGFAGDVAVPLTALQLNEGMDLDAFSIDQVGRGELYSRRLQRVFPVTPISRQAVTLWLGDAQRVRH